MPEVLSTEPYRLRSSLCSPKVDEIPGKDLLKQVFPALPISNVLKLEGLANRDSLPYGSTYDLGPLQNVRTLFRGTLRSVFPGVEWENLMKRTIGR